MLKLWGSLSSPRPSNRQQYDRTPDKLASNLREFLNELLKTTRTPRKLSRRAPDELIRMVRPKDAAERSSPKVVTERIEVVVLCRIR